MSGMTALPICEIELRVDLPKPKGYPHNPITLGDFLKKKRIDENLERREVCDDLNIELSTLMRWEENLIKPRSESKGKLEKYLNR